MDAQKILLPPLHIKLDLLKDFVKGLDRDSAGYKYLRERFPEISKAKLKESILIGSEIRELMKDGEFLSRLASVELEVWNSLVKAVHKFLGNNKSHDYEKVVQQTVTNFRALDCRMSIKLHFLGSQLFSHESRSLQRGTGRKVPSEYLYYGKAVSETMECRMMADYCWSLKRSNTAPDYRRKTFKRRFKK